MASKKKMLVEEYGFALENPRSENVYIEPFMNHSYAELGAILSMAQGLSLLVQSAHWRVKGVNFYEDHLLYERIYGVVSGFIDGTAEKAVGLSEPDLVEPLRVLETAKRFVVDVQQPGAELLADVYRGCEVFSKTVGSYMDVMRSKGSMSEGLENFLQGILDQMEDVMYLLKQRSRV